MNFFAPIIGQTKAIELLSSAFANKRLAPAYLFAGAQGIGRALTARCFSEMVLSQNIPSSEIPSIQKKILTGNHPDLLWVMPSYLERGQIISIREARAKQLKRQAAPQVRIEQIRGITEFLSRSPLEASRKLVAIEAAHLMSESAANALLKTLEEPGKATIILIAPARSLLPTIISRCQQIPFLPLSRSDLELVLQQKGYSEILQHPEILRLANGSPGMAIESFATLETISTQLIDSLKQLPKTALEAIKLAGQINRELEIQTQLWLIDYLQYYYWHHYLGANLVKQLEKTRQYLLAYVQPRLVWETTLLSFC
ncbi:MAG: DNA polymerase III subunit delta' [Prochloraceae cyanobacterium]